MLTSESYAIDSRSTPNERVKKSSTDRAYQLQKPFIDDLSNFH